MFAVTRRTRVQVLVPLRRDLRTAGVQVAVEGIVGQRLSDPEVVENPQVGWVVVVAQRLVVDLEVRRSGDARRDRLGIAGMQTGTGVVFEDVDRFGGAGQTRTDVSGRFGKP